MNKEFTLIACSSEKRSYKSKARDLYISPLFKGSLKYAENQNPDGIFILSAKHGLLGLDKVIESYDQSLNDMRKGERFIWASKVHNQLEEVADLYMDSFTFLAGLKYRKHLTPLINHWHAPMEGLGIGKQLAWLKKETGK